jgi:hypothetical protein
MPIIVSVRGGYHHDQSGTTNLQGNRICTPAATSHSQGRAHCLKRPQHNEHGTTQPASTQHTGGKEYPVQCCLQPNGASPSCWPKSTHPTIVQASYLDQPPQAWGHDRSQSLGSCCLAPTTAGRAVTSHPVCLRLANSTLRQNSIPRQPKQTTTAKPFRALIAA